MLASVFSTALGVPFSNEELTTAHIGVVLYLAVNFRQKQLTFYGSLICKMCKNQQSEDCWFCIFLNHRSTVSLALFNLPNSWLDFMIHSSQERSCNALKAYADTGFTYWKQ